MSANFTSGWLGNGERAWHGEGVVTEGTLPAQEAFETADALFTVEKRENYFINTNFGARSEDDRMWIPTGTYSVVRTDTQDFLGTVSGNYELVQNTALLRMAEFIREEASMDAVVVLRKGANVCFTATLNGSETDIVPGDTVKRRIIGYCGHDGKTGIGVKFTSIRVVCSNTLAFALGSNGAHRSVSHFNGANENFDAIIKSIDCSRRDFAEECELMKEFAQYSMGESAFTEFIDEVYNVQEGEKLRKREQLERLYRYGLGYSYAPQTLWSAVNAVTELETSTKNKTASESKRFFARSNFGLGLQVSKRAMKVATKLVTA